MLSTGGVGEWGGGFGGGGKKLVLRSVSHPTPKGQVRN